MLYGVGDMVKDHPDNERGSLLPPLHGLLFSISSKGYFIYTIQPTERIVHTTSFVIPVELWLEREIVH